MEGGLIIFQKINLVLLSESKLEKSNQNVCTWFFLQDEKSLLSKSSPTPRSLDITQEVNKKGGITLAHKYVL